MSSTVKALFFDLDGTLINTHQANYLAYRQAIDDVLGINVDEKLQEYIQQGRSSHEFLPLVVSDLDGEAIQKINDRKKYTYKLFAGNSIKNDYLVTFLKGMSKHHTTALVTTAKRHNAETVLSAHRLQDYFTFCVYGDEVVKMKPDPEAYLLALERAKVKPSEAIAFEDSNKGAEAAERAGLRVVRIKDFLS